MDTLLLEEMTWPEIRDALQNGMRTVVVCAASIEQHGPTLPSAPTPRWAMPKPKRWPDGLATHWWRRSSAPGFRPIIWCCRAP